MRSPWLGRTLIVLSAITFAGVVYLTRDKNFYYDEWDFVTAYRPGQSTSIWFPHNEHWSTIPILLWKAMFLVFGIRSHIPYEAVAVAGHIACVLLLFALIRRRSGDVPAFASALILLVLGTGAPDIVFAFQITWTLSIAFGLLAMLVIEVTPAAQGWWRIAIVAALLVCSLMSAGIGLGFLAAVTFQLLFDRPRRLFLLAVPPVAVIYLVWFAVYGYQGAPCGGCPTAIGAIRAMDPGYLLTVVSFEWQGLIASVAGMLGMTPFTLPLFVARALLVAFVLLLAWHWSQNGVASWELGLVGGLLTQFTLVALVRARLGIVGATDPHYVYVGVVYLLPLAANALKQISWRPVQREVLAVGVATIVVSNATLLIVAAPEPRNTIQTQNVELRVVEDFRGAAGMALDTQLDPDVMPQLTAAKYFSAIDELGSPVPALVPDSVDALPANLVDRQLVALFGPALTVDAGTNRTSAGSCQTFDATEPSTLDARVPDGGSVMIEASRGGEAAFYLGTYASPMPRRVLDTNLSAATPEWVDVPNTGRGLLWQLRVRTQSAGQLLVCGGDRVQLRAGTSSLSASGASGSLVGGWSSVSDPAAYAGFAARLPGGTTAPSQDAFGEPLVPPAGSYDVWFRVRAADAGGDSPELELGVIDVTTQSYVGATAYRPDQVRSSYSWVRAVTGMVPQPGDRLTFVAVNSSNAAVLSTDWYVDEAQMVPAGASAPSDVRPLTQTNGA